DGFICGHIHSAGFLRSEDGLYCNDGDWVEHCTALVEQMDGHLELLHWSESPVTLSCEPEVPSPELSGDARPVVDVLPAAFLEQFGGSAR
ncbi:MAG: UDP-2,3-diacylglucosamine diphosphatase, partial [Marinobacter sp.]